MGLLKWFSGGSDRSTEAVNLISDLLNELTIGSRNDYYSNIILWEP